MDIRYSLVHLTSITCPPPEFIRTAAKAGYDCVSLRTIPMGLQGEIPHDIAKDHRLLLETRRAAEETGIEIHDTENARIFDGVSIPDYEPALEAAAELGIHHILSNIWTDNKSFYTEKYMELCDLADSYGQTVSVEFVTWASVQDLKTAKELLLASGRKNVGIVLDTLHFYRSRVTLEELGQIPPEWFHYVHLCDAGAEIPTDLESLVHTGRGERLYPGEGAIPIKAILKKLPPVVRGLEVPHLTRLQQFGLEEHARQALERAKNCLQDTRKEGESNESIY